MDEEGAGASPWFWAGFVPGVVYVREGESRQGWSLPYCLIYFLNGFSADDSNPDENYGAVSLNDVLVQLSLLNIPRWGSGDDAWPGSRWDAAAAPCGAKAGGKAGDTGSCHTEPAPLPQGQLGGDSIWVVQAQVSVEMLVF